MYHHQRSGGPPTGASPAPQSSGGPSALPAFSHPHSGIRTPPNGQSPHVSPYATPAPLYAPALPYSYPTIPSSMSRQSSVGAGAWSPAPPPPPPGGGQRATTSAAKYEGGSNEYDDDEEEDEEDDDDEDDEDDDDDEDDSAMSPGTRKRKRDSDGGQARGGGGGGAGSDASPHASVSTYAQSPAAGASTNDSAGASAHKKPKPPRGSKACTHCRKLKMRCTGGENGPPCDRCRHSGYQCIFEESNRGKKAAANAAAAAQAKAEKAAQAALAASKAKGAAGATGGSGQTTQENESLSSGFPTKTKGKGKQSNQDLARSLEKMEQTLESVLRTIRDPAHASSLGHASGMLTRPPSPESSSRGGADHHHKDAAAQQHHRHLDGGRPTSIAPSQLTAPTSHFTQMHQPNSARYASVASAATAGAPMSPPRQRSVRMAATGSSSGAGRDGEGSRSHRPTSPRLHSLPPDSLNPLGLLAEASLGNQMGSVRRSKSTNVVAGAGAADGAAGAEAEGDDEGGSSTREASATSSSQRVGKTAGFADQATAGKDGSASRNTSSTNRARSITGNGPALGVASKTYFRPGPMSMLPLRKVIIDRELPPELLTSGVVSDTEVLDLFSIFFHNCAQHIILLDPEWHTPQFVCGRSPFLFTVILAIASRYYARRPDLHGQCLRQATKEAFNCLERGFKSVEIVQAFLLLTMWGQPARRFEEDKSWIFAGIAFRVATDLNLHRKSMATLPGQGNLDDPAMMEREKEIRNRERTWIFCFVVDRSLSSQFGKPSVIREDFILRNTRSWALSPTAQPADMALSAIVGLQRLTSRQTDLLYSSVTSVTGLNQDLDFSSMIRIFSEQLEEWRQFWTLRGLVIGDCRNRQPEIPPNDGTLSPREMELRQLFAVANRDTPPPEDGDHTIRTLYYLIQQAPLRFHYAALTLHSFGLQFGNQIDDRGVQFIRCYDSAKGIFFAARDGMRPILRYASDTQILIIAFSLVFMLKLTRPTFSRYADTEEILRLVEEGADMLEEVAASPLHTPALYGHFLRATLAQARADMAARAAGGGAGAATNGYPSRAGSPTPGGNGNGGDDGPSVAAAFGLPQDPALGGTAGGSGDPSLAPMPTGTTRHNSISDAAMAQAFAAAAGGNVNQFQQGHGQMGGMGGMAGGHGNGFPYPGFSAAPLPSSNAMGGGGTYGANNAFNPLAFLSTPTLGGGNGAFGGGPTSTMTSQPSGSAAGPSAGAAAQFGGGGNGGQPDASSLLLDNVWWNQLVPAGLGGPLDGLNGGIDLLQHEAEHGVLGGGGGGNGGGAGPAEGSGEVGQSDAQRAEDGEATPTKQRQSEGAEGQEGGTSANEGAAGGGDSMRTRSAPVDDGAAATSTASQDDPDAQPRTRSSSTTTTTAAMGKGFGAGTGVTRPSSPSNANAAAGAGAGGAGVLNQFAGSFLTFDFS